MAVNPILFNTDMVRAILDGRKTVTRRIIKPQPVARLCYAFAGSNGMPGTWGYPSRDAYERWGEAYKLPDDLDEYDQRWRAPCRADDVLWVRETWAHVKFGIGDWHYEYRADQKDIHKFSNGSFSEWRPSIHMPRDAARLFLQVTEVCVERLQEMTARDSLDEGVKLHLDSILKGDSPLAPFARLWDSTVKQSDLWRYGWDANPWVWVIKFKRTEQREETPWG